MPRRYLRAAASFIPRSSRWCGAHGEAITTRPLFQQAIARRTRHANQTRLYISSIHAKAMQAAHLLDRISTWLKLFVQPAEQLGYKAGKFPFDPAPEEGALVPVNCWIWNKGSGR